jgi:hypothetical protein
LDVSARLANNGTKDQMRWLGDKQGRTPSINDDKQYQHQKKNCIHAALGELHKFYKTLAAKMHETKTHTNLINYGVALVKTPGHSMLTPFFQAMAAGHCYHFTLVILNQLASGAPTLIACLRQ